MVGQTIHGQISETRQEYAQNHYRANPNNNYTCEEIVENEIKERLSNFLTEALNCFLII